MREFLEKIRSCNKSQILVLFLTGVLLLIIAIPAEDKKEYREEMAEVPKITELSKTRELEEKLEEILSHVSGIGKVEAMISVKSEGRKIVEKDKEYSEGKEENLQENGNIISSQKSQMENTVYQKDMQGNENPYVTEELSPEISGVLVIAQGAGNAGIAAEITEAVMALFGVEAHKIKVMKMD